MYKLICLLLAVATLVVLSCSLKGVKTGIEVSRPVFSGSPVLVLNN